MGEQLYDGDNDGGGGDCGRPERKPIRVEYESTQNSININISRVAVRERESTKENDFDDDD